MSRISRTPAAGEGTKATIEVPEDQLREVIETLARLDRTPCSPGEREAAEWVAGRFRRAGCSDVALEEEHSWGTWPPNLTALGLLGLLGTILVLARRRLGGAVVSLLALGGLVDEVQNGPRLYRQLVRRKKSTLNAVASVGDAGAERTVVVLAHHDAAQTGRIFDQTWAKTLHRMRPDAMAASKNQVPQWWLGVAGPLLTLVSAVIRWRRPARWALGLGVAGTAAVADIARSPTVPGANDNLSGVAVLVGIAEALRAHPIQGVRVLLVSCGAEETLQDGIRAFMARHASELDPEKTYFVNFDTVGSPHLVMLEGEGPIWMEDYADPSFRDLVETRALELRIELERGVRARASTDAIIPSRAGHSTATFVSLMPWRMPGNYHLMSDVPENIDYATVADSVRLGYAIVEVARRG